MEILRYPLQYRRLTTRVVSIGKLKIGGSHPLCLQSMLTCSIQDIDRCLDEIRSLLAVKCQLIRLTIPSRKDLDSAYHLKRRLQANGLEVPLVADIHFSPALAVDACEVFEKVRINPGNYSDTPKKAKQIFSTVEFEEGRARLSEAIRPLVANLKKYNRALRIGVNQGSLASRMIERYGDSPLGMVHSALEMIQLFEEQGFDQLVVSLKSSNPIIVQKAYRLLVLKQEGRIPVPMHLGVTEAGDGLMGRIKSLAGIGPLLMDGIGDTIRISLTEPSANEILFAKAFLPEILKSDSDQSHHQDFWDRPIHQQRLLTESISVAGQVIGNGNPVKIGKRQGTKLPESNIPFEPDFCYFGFDQHIKLPDQKKPLLYLANDRQTVDLATLSSYSSILLSSAKPLLLLRSLCHSRGEKGSIPVGYLLPETIGFAILTQLAGMLSEGLLDYILIPDSIKQEDYTSFLLVLQVTRSRILVADYITCPSCGRTLFDIQRTAAQIKARTSHLKGIKIGVMGCIVNGPGEMADADFGYVGSGPGKIDLYFGQERICRGIPEENAVERLLLLIKEKGFWVERQAE